MSTQNTHTPRASADGMPEALSMFLVGGGILTMALFPLALPLIALVAAPVIALGVIVLAAAVLIVAVTAAPFLLLRLVRRALGASGHERDQAGHDERARPELI